MGRVVATCTICNSRKGKRSCTARGEDICTQCCATERENTINCPYSCEYLRESRLHEKRTPREEDMPHRDIRVDAEFMGKSDLVLMLMSAFLNKALQPVPNATDRDVREVLEALVSTYRSAVAGSPETVTPSDEVAAGIMERFREKMSAFVQDLKEREAGPFADRVFLGISVFMARVAYGYDNGRPRCRAYVHYLRSTFPEGED